IYCVTKIARNYCRLFLRRKIAKGKFDFLNKPVWLAVQTDREAHGWGLSGGTENSGLCAFSLDAVLYLTALLPIFLNWQHINSQTVLYSLPQHLFFSSFFPP